MGDKVSALKILSARNLPKPEYLPTPSFGLNRALGGKGLQSGRIHVYWGPKASGKTTAALHQAKEAQEQGKRVVVWDSEKAFSLEWAEKIGVDLDTLGIIKTNSAEKGLVTLTPGIDSEEIDLLIVDSLSSIAFDSFLNDPASNPMGIYARSAKAVTQQLLHAIQPHTQIILISHAVMDITPHGSFQKASIGSAVDHWSSTQVKFRKGKGEKDKRADGAFKVYWKLEKSKQSDYPVIGSYWFTKDATIDYSCELVDIGIEEGIIRSAGAWVYFGEDKWNGKVKMAEEVKYNLTLKAELEAVLLDNGVKVLEDDVGDEDE